MHYLRIVKTGRGAVWLAHQYGVLGVGGSNPLVPTIEYVFYVIRYITYITNQNIKTMGPRSKNNKTESIKDRTVEHIEDISTDILEDIRKIPQGKSGLVIIKGPNIGDKFLINKPELTIGRNPASDIFLDDITVSRKHAVIIKSGKDFRIKDSESLNGSYLNGKIIENAILKDMDRLQIGKYIFLFFHSGVNN